MDEARKLSLIEEFTEEIVTIANETDDGSVPLEDLIQEGYVGLLRGIKELDNETADQCRQTAYFEQNSGNVCFIEEEQLLLFPVSEYIGQAGYHLVPKIPLFLERINRFGYAQEVGILIWSVGNDSVAVFLFALCVKIAGACDIVEINGFSGR